MSIESPPGKVVRLSARELEVARLVAEGLTNREIAAKLYLSERTVDGHLEHIREKLGVGTRAQVTAWVIRNEAAPQVAAPAAKPQSRPRRFALAHPRAWLAAALVLALLTTAVGVLRLTEPPPPTIETVAGSACVKPDGNPCPTSDGVSATAATLSRPTSVAVDSKGVIYIADYGEGLIRKVSGGTITTAVGGGDLDLASRVPGQAVSSPSLGHASTIAVDNHDQLYVLTNRDSALEIWRLDEAGLMQFVANLGPTHAAFVDFAANLPVGGLAIADDGMIYASDRAGNRVVQVRDGQVLPYAGTGSTGDGGSARTALLSWPVGLALDRGENLYIADTGRHRIRKVDHRTGVITTVAGSYKWGDDSGDGGPATQARLNFPFDVVIAPDGRLVIADSANNRVRVVADGTIEPLAGTGRWGFYGDGASALSAEFNGPEGIAVDRKGDLFIADTENQRVREIPRVLSA